MNPLIFASIFAIIYGILISFIGDKIIDFLFIRKRYDLTFPDEIYNRGKNRKTFLFMLSAISAFVMALNFNPLELAFGLIFASCMVICTKTDLEQHLIFDLVLFPYAILGIIALFSMGLPVKNHLIAALGLFLVTLIFAVISRGGMGGGDIKLLTVIGLWLGEDLALLTFVSGAVLGGIFAIIMVALKKADRNSYFAYGPFFTISALAILAVAGFQF